MFDCFKRTFVLPFKYDIPHYTQKYLESTSLYKRFLKFFRRYLYILFNGQLNLQRDTIQSFHKNILWINLSAPSLGDSLMDLSSRILLEDKNVDLFTDKKNAHIYKSDKIFDEIIVDENEIKQNKYDLIIIDSYSTRSLRVKIKNTKNVPYVGMYGYYNGPEVNRVLYSFHQMNNLLEYKVEENVINATARASMFISPEDEQKINELNLPNEFISIVLGGEWDYRTFNNWGKVIHKILSFDLQTNIVFVGSSNAVEIANVLVEKFDNKNLINCVAKYSFNQTAEIIKRSKLLLCCDGGLMHAANGVGTDIIPLFAHLTPKMQLTNAINAFALFDEKNVNNINYKDIVENYKKCLNSKI